VRSLWRTGQILLTRGATDRVAAAFALGVFIAFFPILGIHSAMALALAVVFRLNKSHPGRGLDEQPWTIAPIYTAGTLMGCLVLGSRREPRRRRLVAPRARVLRVAPRRLPPLLLPFVVGSLLLGAVAGTLSFLVCGPSSRAPSGAGVRRRTDQMGGAARGVRCSLEGVSRAEEGLLVEWPAQELEADGRPAAKPQGKGEPAVRPGWRAR